MRIQLIFVYVLIIYFAIAESSFTNRIIKDSSNSDSSDSSEGDKGEKKEHDTLDFVGRDIVKGIDKTVGKITGGVSFAIDKIQYGVGKALGTVVKGTNYTVTKLHDGVDKTVDKIHDNVENVVDTVEKIRMRISNKTSGLDTNTTFFSGVIDKFKDKVKAIYPGTKWCGEGDRARSYDDLGRFAGTDACCREHDLCPDDIQKGQTKYDLINTGLFTRSHCDCDKQFYKCLKADNSTVSKKIGFTYFTILRPQCFKEDYPIIDCNKSEHGKCVEYEYDRTGPKIYQWFDSPTF